MTATAPPSPEDLVRQRAYVRLLLFAALIGVPVSLVAYGFIVFVDDAETWLWHTLPGHFGFGANAPWWWPLPLLTVAGVLVGLVIRYLPGRGGHLPANGLSAGATQPIDVPGVALAALIGLPLGVVLGPEAPLIGIGTGLALLAARRPATDPGGTDPGSQVVAVSGAAAAISVVLGNPLVAAVLLIEMLQLTGLRLALTILPCLLSAGLGSLMFLGLGAWTGVTAPSLAAPLPPSEVHLDLPDLLWTVPLAVVAAVFVRVIRLGAQRLARRTTPRPVVGATLVALGVGVCVAVYALTTGRPPSDAALSGQLTLANLVSDPASWSIGALFALLIFKGGGYALSLAALRGGPIFPAVCLGAALGVLVSPLPGYGFVPALAAGMAATIVSILSLPVTGILLVVLILGRPGIEVAPVAILAGVIGFLVEQWLTPRARR